MSGERRRESSASRNHETETDGIEESVRSHKCRKPAPEMDDGRFDEIPSTFSDLSFRRQLAVATVLSVITALGATLHLTGTFQLSAESRLVLVAYGLFLGATGSTVLTVVQEIDEAAQQQSGRFIRSLPERKQYPWATAGLFERTKRVPYDPDHIDDPRYLLEGPRTGRSACIECGGLAPVHSAVVRYNELVLGGVIVARFVDGQNPYCRGCTPSDT